MRFLVIGCGSIGQRHIRNLKNLGHSICGCEKDISRLRAVKNKYGIEMFSGLTAALNRDYDGVFICTPTSLHVPLATRIAKRGMHLFIEKPLSHNLNGIKELSKITEQKNLVVLVGCNIRFMRGFKFVKKLIESGKIGKILSARIECGYYLPYWHPQEDYRASYSANKRLGGGAIFDDIHEIDSLYWLFGKAKEVFCFAGKISDLEIDTEDIAEIFLKFNSNIIAQIHLDYLQRTYRRSYEFIGEKGTIYFDILKQRVELYGKINGKCRIFEKSIKRDFDEMFAGESRHFINCIKRKEESINDISVAKHILGIALACHKSAKRKEVICL